MTLSSSSSSLSLLSVSNLIDCLLGTFLRLWVLLLWFWSDIYDAELDITAIIFFDARAGSGLSPKSIFIGYGFLFGSTVFLIGNAF